MTCSSNFVAGFAPGQALGAPVLDDPYLISLQLDCADESPPSIVTFKQWYPAAVSQNSWFPAACLGQCTKTQSSSLHKLYDLTTGAFRRCRVRVRCICRETKAAGYCPARKYCVIHQVRQDAYRHVRPSWLEHPHCMNTVPTLQFTLMSTTYICGNAVLQSTACSLQLSDCFLPENTH